MLDKIFKLQERGSSVRTEMVAGLTTFLSMAYIIFVNPDILGTTGMDKGALFVATCLAAAIGCFVMGLWANWPIGMAPGMGLNAFFAFTVVAGMGWSWQAALGAVFISGVIFIVLTATGVRKHIVASIPRSLQAAIPAGIGLFLALIALGNAGIVVKSDTTKVAMGVLQDPKALMAIFGFFVIAVLDFYKVRGAILIGIFAVTLLSVILGYAHFQGLLEMPPSLAPTFLQMDISGAFSHGIMSVVMSLVLVEIFDATGTLTGVARRAGLIGDDPAKSKGLSRALFADSTAIVAGSCLGTSSTTAYIESISGVQAGGRTGLTAVTVGILFLLALFFSPLVGLVPTYAVAPALVYVAALMLAELSHVAWDDITESVPAAIATLVMPFTYSIANGLGFGFIAYAILKLITGKAKDVHIGAWIIAALFFVRYAFFAGVH